MLRLAAPILTLCLLGAIGLDSGSRRAVPEGAKTYHERVKDSMSLIPYRVGDWVGVDKEIRQEALQILDANFSLSRTYYHIGTGDTATLLVVQCADARSLLGHYPPVCYPSQGWTQVQQEPLTITVDNQSVLATRYTFNHDTLVRSSDIEVVHFSVLPDGRTAPDLGLLDRAARDKQAKHYGGASLQFVLDASLPAERRQEIYKVLLRASSEWIRAVQSGKAI